MKIEEGKYYRTADGRKVGPMKPSVNDVWPWIVMGEVHYWTHNGVCISGTDASDIVAEWPEYPKLWRDMTPEEKGALLLAHHEGKVIEMTSYIPGTSQLAWNECPSNWRPTDTGIYRIRPEPVRETVVRYYQAGDSVFDTHLITFETVDGEPDCASIKMEKL